jgi:hypothetical protein
VLDAQAIGAVAREDECVGVRRRFGRAGTSGSISGSALA